MKNNVTAVTVMTVTLKFFKRYVIKFSKSLNPVIVFTKFILK